MTFTCTHEKTNLLRITKSKLHTKPFSNQVKNIIKKHCKTFETSLSDYHKLIISTIMKSGIFEGSSKKKIYWSYKFENESFSNALRE